MLSLRTAASITDAALTYADPSLRKLIGQRVALLSRNYDGDLGELAHFLVIEPGDSLGEIKNELGFSPLTNKIDGAIFGDPDFTPSWELMRCHGPWFEVVFILSDDGFGAILFIKNDPGIEFDLHALCLEYADQCCPDMPQHF